VCKFSTKIFQLYSSTRVLSWDLCPQIPVKSSCYCARHGVRYLQILAMHMMHYTLQRNSAFVMLVHFIVCVIRRDTLAVHIDEND